MNKRAEELIRTFDMTMLPVENTYIKELYRSETLTADGLPTVTTMYGLYTAEPVSHSCFHVLTRDEVWSFYEGDPIELFLLYPDGHSEIVILGPDMSKGQVFQHTITAGIWQGGRLAPGGEYALYGCTVAPGFTPECFTGPDKEWLESMYPDMKDIIQELT